VPGLRAGIAALAVALTLPAVSLRLLALGSQLPPFVLRYTNIAREAGLDMTLVFGGREAIGARVHIAAAGAVDRVDVRWPNAAGKNAGSGSRLTGSTRSRKGE
jgi:hypothetical protein